MSSELATLEPASTTLPMTVAEAKATMQRYQEITQAMLDTTDWIGPPGGDESFVKRQGWDKIANAYKLSVEILSQSIDRAPDGSIVRAHAVVRASTPERRSRDGDGGCGINEPRFAKETGRQKIEHDIPATAVTRATNRAISNLVGFGQVSAEEVDADVRAQGARLPAWALVDDSLKHEAGESLKEIIALAGANTATAKNVAQAVRDECGGLPRCVAMTLFHIRRALESAPADADPRDAAPPPGDTSDELGGDDI